MKPEQEAKLFEDIGGIKANIASLLATSHSHSNNPNSRRRYITPSTAVAGSGWVGAISMAVLVVLDRLG